MVFSRLGKGKGKSSGESGKGRSGKGMSRDRKPLSQRILRSQCRRCFQFGHWKDECPLKSQDGASSVAASSPAPSSSFTGMATMNVPDSLPLEFLNLQEFGETGLDVIDEAPRCETIVSEVFVCEGVTTQGVNGFLGNNIDKSCNVTMALHRLRHSRVMKHQNDLKEIRSCDRIDPSGEAKVFSASGDLSSRASFGILETGATKTVIGSQLIKGLMNSLDPEIRKQVGRCSFRFGNHIGFTTCIGHTFRTC